MRVEISIFSDLSEYLSMTNHTNLTNISAWLSPGDLPDPHHGQGGQGEGGDEPPQDMAPRWVDILPLVVGGCAVVYEGEGPDNLENMFTTELYIIY